MPNFKEHFYACRDNLFKLPVEFNKWKTLNSYREEWHFLPNTLKERVVEYNAMIDYHLSLNLWLNPVGIFYKREKVLLAQLIANIYEGVLNYKLSEYISNRVEGDNFLKEVLNNSALSRGKKQTFGIVYCAAYQAGIIDSHWSAHMAKFAEIRNWVHLSKDESQEMREYLERFTLTDLREKLDIFRRYIESR